MLLPHLRRLLRDRFLLGMLLAVGLAGLTPQFGRSGGTLHLDAVSNAGIFTVFFLHGIALSMQSLRAGLLNWRLHTLVQAHTFLVFPLLWLALDALFGAWVPQGLMLGFWYLCALPSTISSSVAMTALGRGNVPGAIFNATLSSLLGIVLTPLLVSLMVAHGGEGGRGPGEAILNIAGLLLAPFVLGQLLRPWLGAWFAERKRWTGLIDRGVILMLVYGSFCDATAGGLWSDYGAGVLATAFAGSALLLAIVLGLSRRAARLFGFSVEDEVAAVFCGSKKTLASGMPMAKLLFGASPALGLVVLPILLYHPLQLFVCSVMAERYAARPAR